MRRHATARYRKKIEKLLPRAGKQVYSGTIPPLIEDNNGLGMIVFGAASVCDVSGAGFTTPSGNALATDFCGSQSIGSTYILFSQDVTSISFNYATNAVGLIPVEYGDLLNPSASGGFNLGTVSYPATGYFESVAAVSGGAPFDALNFDPAAEGYPDYAIDSITVTFNPVPEPSSLALLGTGALALIGMGRRKLRA